MTRRVVITGVGAVTPLGVGASALHDEAVRGRSGVLDGVGRCIEFDPLSVLTRREAHRMDRFTQLAVVAAVEAVEQSGWHDGPPVAAQRISCVIGTAIGGLVTLETELSRMHSEGMDYVSPLTVPMLMANAAAAQLALRFALRGESAALVSACSGGAQAIVAGIRAIRAGEVDMALVGGAEAATTDFTRAIFLAAGALSPTGRSRPFHRDRDGFVLGEGAGILVLEAAETAERRGATVLGEIVGYGVTTDAHHITAPDPTGEVAAAAVCLALTQAGLRPEDVCYINAHGTGTRLNDVTEVTALRKALGDALRDQPISSSKSYLGHLLGAAGAVETIATLQALRSRTAPPTHGLTIPDELLGKLSHVPVALPLVSSDRGCVGLTNSMGFGGHNVALLVRV